MKLCFFNLNGYSLFNSKSQAPLGGTEIQLYRLACYFSQQNEFSVSYATGDWGQPPVEKFKQICIYKTAKVNHKIFNLLTSPFIIWKVLKKINADIYLCSASGPELGLIALFCKIYHKQLVFRVASNIDCDTNFLPNNLLRKVYFFGLKNTNKIIAQSNEQKNKLSHLLRLKSTVLKSLYEIKSDNTNSKKSYILWVGSCQQLKNPKLYLEVVKRFPAQKFVMICPVQKNQEVLYNSLKKSAKKLDNLTLIPKVPFDRIQTYFNHAKILIGTSDFEGFPNVYIQACIGKTPIVSYKVNPDNFITKNNAGYVSDGNFETMISQIKILLTNNKTREQFSQNAFNYVKNNHDINIIGKQWKKILFSLQ